MVIIDTPTGQQVSTEILPKTSDYTPQFSYREREFEEIAKQDMALVYLYTPTNPSNERVLAAIEIASALQNLYRWEICLVTGQIYPYGHQEISQVELKDIQLQENPPIIGRFFVFQYTTTNRSQAVLYWFESATFAVNSTTQQKHVKISLIAYPETLEEIPSLEKQMVGLAKAITSYWQPIKTWSPLVLILSQNGIYLVTITSILLGIVLILYILETRKQRKANTKAYQKLSKPNKQIIDTILETQKTTIPTLNAIATTYTNRTGEPIEKEELLRRISEAQKTGIIKSHIASNQDEPIQIWKAQMFS